MARFEQLLLQMDEGAFAVDARRRVVFWNPACERLLQTAARAVLGRPCHEVIGARRASGERYCGAACALADLAAGGAAPKPMPLWFGGRQQPLWLSVFLVPSRWDSQWTVIHLLQRSLRAQGVGPGMREDAPTGSSPGRRSGTGGRERAALTPREKEVLGLLALGMCVAQIADRLHLSPVTVRNHVQHLIAKLGVHSQLEAVAYAYRNDLVEPAAQPGACPASAVAVAA